MSERKKRPKKRPMELFKSVVTKVVLDPKDGDHEPYFHAERLSDGAHFTVSCKGWNEAPWPPEKGLFVMLGRVGGKPAGLRAGYGRLWRESDG